MEYMIVYKYKASWFWKKQKVTGHSYNKEVDKLILFKKDVSYEQTCDNTAFLCTPNTNLICDMGTCLCPDDPRL